MPRLGMLGAVARLAQHDFHVHLVPRAIDSHGDGVTRAVLVHCVGEVLLIADGISVNGDDEIAADRDRRAAEIGSLGAAA